MPLLDQLTPNDVVVRPLDGLTEIVHVGSGAVTETVAESQVLVPPGLVATRERRWLPVVGNSAPEAEPAQATAP